MAALWILGILLALIVAALFLRVGVRIAFGQELRVTAAAGPVRMQIVPRPPKKPKNRKSTRRKRIRLKSRRQRSGRSGNWA